MDFEEKIRKEFGLSERVNILSFFKEILEQAKAWQSMNFLIPENCKKLPYLIQANRLSHEIEAYRDLMKPNE